MRSRLSLTPLEDRITPVTLPDNFTQSLVVTGLTRPTAMDVAPDGRIFVTEKDGAIRVVKNGTLLSTPFARLDVNESSEQGLLGIVLDPNFAANQFVYVFYSIKDGSTQFNRIGRLTANGDVATGLPTTIFDLPPSLAEQHMSGGMHFGPDGKLYITSGDQCNPALSQSLDNLFGKVLRINSDGTIPSDNPTTFDGVNGTTSGINRAIWAIGLRNAYTFAFQPGTGKMFINDVGSTDEEQPPGERAYEEINLGRAGANYGWPSAEGPYTAPGVPGVTYPIYAYTHGYGELEGFCVVGSVFYNPDVQSFPDEYVGDYFFADLGNKIFVRDGVTGEVTLFAGQPSVGPLDIDLLPDGSLIYLSFGDGTNNGEINVIRYTFGDQPPDVDRQPENLLVSVGESATFRATVNGTAPLQFQWQRDTGSGFADVPGATGPTYTETSASLAENGHRFRLVVTNAFGTDTSDPATLSVTNSQRPTVSIVTPEEGFRFRAGESVSFSFAGSDPETGNLPASAFVYSVVDITGTSIPRPVITNAVGKSGSFTVPNTTPYQGTDVVFRIIVTVTDSAGLTATTFRDFQPLVSSVRIATNGFGASLSLDGIPIASGQIVNGIAGITREVSAPAFFEFDGRQWEFESWSDGGARTHRITIPDTPQDLVARYRLLGAVLGSESPGLLVSAVGQVERYENGAKQIGFQPFGAAFTGEVRIASGDLNGDGVADIVAAAGPGGGPRVVVLDGVTGEELKSFFAYSENFTGGVFVAVGDVDGDGVQDIVLTAGPGGGPHVKVLRFTDLAELRSFYAYAADFTGGVRVAAADVDGDGAADIVTSAGSSGGPHVRVLDGRTLAELMSFFAYAESFTGGVWISAADLDQDGFAEVITGAGPGAAPHVKAFRRDASEFTSFYAYDEAFTGGVRTGASDANSDGYPEIVTGAGPGGGPHAKAFRSDTGELVDSVFLDLPDYTGGVFVG